MCGTSSLFSLEKHPPNWWNPSLLCVTALGMLAVFRTSCLCLSFLSLWSFTPLLWRSSSPTFWIFFTGKQSIFSCRFGVSMGEDEYRILLCHHLMGVPPCSVHWRLVHLEWEKIWDKSIFFTLFPNLNICQRWLIFLTAKPFSSLYYTFANKWINK